MTEANFQSNHQPMSPRRNSAVLQYPFQFAYLDRQTPSIFLCRNCGNAPPNL
jgi:hypothetical protein